MWLELQIQKAYLPCPLGGLNISTAEGESSQNGKQPPLRRSLCFRRQYRSSSSPPQPQYSLEKPLIWGKLELTLKTKAIGWSTCLRWKGYFTKQAKIRHSRSMQQVKWMYPIIIEECLPSARENQESTLTIEASRGIDWSLPYLKGLSILGWTKSRFPKSMLEAKRIDPIIMEESISLTDNYILWTFKKVLISCKEIPE
jgi:hypothetical protein